jgi:hypothetical protein
MDARITSKSGWTYMYKRENEIERAVTKRDRDSYVKKNPMEANEGNINSCHHSFLCD